MAIEIERKFLVTGETWRDEADDGTPIRQAYLANGAGASVRVRCAANRAWITVKGEREGIARPRVLIPVFPGTNCEYDSARAFEAALGCDAAVGEVSMSV